MSFSVRMSFRIFVRCKCRKISIQIDYVLLIKIHAYVPFVKNMYLQIYIFEGFAGSITGFGGRKFAREEQLRRPSVLCPNFTLSPT